MQEFLGTLCYDIPRLEGVVQMEDPTMQGRMTLAEQRVQLLQDSALQFNLWAGEVNRRMAHMEADIFELKTDMKQVHRAMAAIVKHLDIDMGEDDS